MRARMARFIAPGPVVRSGQRAIHVDLGHWAERRRVDPMCIQPTATSARSMSFIADDQIPRRAPDRAAGRCLAQASRHALPVHDSRQRFCRSSARYPRRQVARYVVVGTTNGFSSRSKGSSTLVQSGPADLRMVDTNCSIMPHGPRVQERVLHRVEASLLCDQNFA